MRCFKFTSEYTYEGKSYKEGLEFRIVDWEVINNDGEWIFDCDSPLAKQHGIVINR
jgi:hypothetical protein